MLKRGEIGTMLATEDTTLAHSYVYDDPRAHRAIARWAQNLPAPSE
jgi:hypothetical protein